MFRLWLHTFEGPLRGIAAILGRLTTFMLGKPFTSLDRYTGSASAYMSREASSILLAISIMVTVGSPFLGLVLAGWVGVVAGVIDWVLTLIRLRAVIKVREIQEGS